jgi:hypothetical protein
MEALPLMRAAVLSAPGAAVEIREVEFDDPRSTEVEVAIAAAGVCGSDLHVRRSGAELLKYAVIPFLGFAFTIYLWTKLSELTFEIGLGWLAAGLLWLVYLTRGFRRPPPEMYTGDEEDLDSAPKARTA